MALPTLALATLSDISGGCCGLPSPGIVSATIAASGTSLTVVWNQAMSIGAGGAGGLSVKGAAPADASVAATYSSGDGTGTWVFTLASPIYNTEDITLDYVQPGNGIENSGGSDLPSISDGPATNNSTNGTGILRDGSGNPVRDGNSRAIKIT